MSILKEIKGTLQSVQQDISTSIKSLTVSTKDKEVGKSGVARVKAASSRGVAVNLDAGADILHRYQENWSELHHQAEENATRAENTAISIGSLFVKINQQSRSLAQLAEEAQGLPTILQQLQDLTNQIACVEELCEQVEAAEIQLENVCEEEEFRQAQTAHHMQLALYRQKKQAAADKHRVELAQQHARNVKSRDTKRQSQLQERQSIFQEAFDNDVNYYRTFGKTERQPSVEKEAAPVDLADIKIDDEAEDLDNFLESADNTPVSDRPQEFNEEMPEMDDDSGVIHDDSGSPEPVSHYPTTDQSDNSVPINNETEGDNSGDEKLRDISSGKTAETETSDEASVTGSGSYDQGHDQSKDHEVSVQPDTHPQPVKNLASELETAEMLHSEAESLQPAPEVLNHQAN